MTRVPPTLLVYALLAAISIAAEPLITDLDAAYATGAAILALGTVGMLLRLWIAWAFLVVVHLGDIVVGVGSRWFLWILVVNGVMVSLLLARSTRRYVRKGYGKRRTG